MAEDTLAPPSSLPDFSAERWEPDVQVYGVMHLAQYRAVMIAASDGKLPQPTEISHIKFLRAGAIAKAASDTAAAPDDSGQIGTPALNRADAAAAVTAAVMEETAATAEAHQLVAAPGPSPDSTGPREAGQDAQLEILPSAPEGGPGTWWRASRNEEVVVREGMSLWSREIERHPSGSYLLQAAAIGTLERGRERGIVRMPIHPRGWVTLDASPAGGPRYFEIYPAAPRWRVAHKSGTKHGDVLVRATRALDSREVGVLWHGDYVEQIGATEVQQEPQGKDIFRMPVAILLAADTAATLAATQLELKFRKSENGDWTGAARAEAERQVVWNAVRRPDQLCGWVTVDASKAGGPRFFEECRMP